MKYCSKIIEEIAKEIENGSSQKDAAILCGASETTYYRWMEEEDKWEFRERIKEAHATYKKKLVQRIQKSADNGTWQAGAWLLERKYKDEYAVRKEQTGKEGEPLPSPVIVRYDPTKQEAG